MDEKTLFDQLNTIATEQRNPASMNLDVASVAEILKIINNEDKRVAIAVEQELPYIEQAISLVIDALRSGGRLIYLGAGTSGRLGVLDAAECPPTFGTDPEQIQGMIAGGEKAMFRAQEGAEDHEENGAHDVDAKKVTKKMSCAELPRVLGPRMLWEQSSIQRRRGQRPSM